MRDCQGRQADKDNLKACFRQTGLRKTGPTGKQGEADPAGKPGRQRQPDGCFIDRQGRAAGRKRAQDTPIGAIFETILRL
mgnify:CR=1 FL=1